MEHVDFRMFNAALRNGYGIAKEDHFIPEDATVFLFNEFKNRKTNLISKSAYMHMLHFIYSFYTENFDVLEMPGLRDTRYYL